MHETAPVTPDAPQMAADVGLSEIADGAGERWNWRWRSWTRWPLSLPIVGLAFVTVVVDVGTAWANISLGSLGRVPVSPALPLGILLAVMVGLRRLGLDPANRRAWREFLAVSSVALVYAGWSYAVKIGGPAESVGLVLAALGEELVYRLAVLIVVGVVVAAALRRPWRNAEDWGAVPGIAALLAGGLVFTLLPGHIAQMSRHAHRVAVRELGRRARVRRAAHRRAAAGCSGARVPQHRDDRSDRRRRVDRDAHHVRVRGARRAGVGYDRRRDAARHPRAARRSRSTCASPAPPRRRPRSRSRSTSEV